MEKLLSYDADRASQFAERILDQLNKTAVSFMISIGHRTGLFDHLQDGKWRSSETIASETGLNERYVREWLGAMVTGQVMEYGAATKTYRLPEEHAASLTRKAGADNLAVFMQYAAVMGAVEDDIIDCFRNGGGVPYSKYHRFHEIMAEDSGLSVVSSLESHILPLVPGLTDRLVKGIRVSDLGCGSGRIINKLAELFPASHFTGYDLSDDALHVGRKEAAEKGLQNIELIQKDLSDFDETAPEAAFDLITTFDAIHDQGKPLQVLKGIYKALKDDGVYIMQDINGTSRLEEDIRHPIAPFLYSISCMHCMTVSLAQGGEGLGAMWGEERTKDYVLKAGFKDITVHKLAHDIQNNWYTIRKNPLNPKL